MGGSVNLESTKSTKHSYTMYVCTMKWCVIFMFFFLSNIVTCIASVYLAHKGSFNNYVDKMRGGEGSKNVCFCSRSGYKNYPRRRGVGGTDGLKGIFQ